MQNGGHFYLDLDVLIHGLCGKSQYILIENTLAVVKAFVGFRSRKGYEIWCVSAKIPITYLFYKYTWYENTS